jgi:hypothetical protein
LVCNLKKLDLNIILDNKDDIIIKYQVKLNKKIKELIIELAVIKDYLKANNGKGQLIDLLQYILSCKYEIEIINIQKFIVKEYIRKNFLIKKKKERKYGNEILIYVYIQNIVTGKEFEDWVKPNQINSISELNKLIYWDMKGEEITF